MGRRSNSAALAGAMAISAYVVGTLVRVFAGIALYRKGRPRGGYAATMTGAKQAGRLIGAFHKQILRTR